VLAVVETHDDGVPVGADRRRLTRERDQERRDSGS
jgi:hypothetical protein